METVPHIRHLLQTAAEPTQQGRFPTLYSRMWTNDLLRAAWLRVARAERDPRAIDDVERFGVEPFLDDLGTSLHVGDYIAAGLPIRDRVVQTAARLVLEPIFNPDFLPSSVGDRALPPEAWDQLSGQHRYALVARIRDFVRYLDRAKLLTLIARRVPDPRMLGLIEQWLDGGALTGGMLAPLLTNIYLHVVDVMWARHRAACGVLVRCGDELVVLCDTAERCDEAERELVKHLARLGLELDPERTRHVELRDRQRDFDFVRRQFGDRMRLDEPRRPEPLPDLPVETEPPAGDLDMFEHELYDETIRDPEFARYLLELELEPEPAAAPKAPVRTPADERKGVLFAVLSAVLLAGVILTAKTLLRTMTPWGFTTFFFSSGAVWFTLYFLVRRDFAVFMPSLSAIRAGLVVGALDAGYTLSAFSALQVLTPGVYAFFSHMADVLTPIVGLVILRERFARRELAGFAIAFIGLITMTAQTTAVVAKGFVLMLISAVFFAANAVAVKRFTRVHSPIYLAYYRAIALAALLVALSFTVFSFRLPTGKEWALLALLGFLGPFLNYLFFFSALKRLEIGRVSVIRICYSVLVVIGAYFIYSQLPTTRQIAGGLTMLTGVGLAVLERSRRARVRASPSSSHRA